MIVDLQRTATLIALVERFRDPGRGASCDDTAAVTAPGVVLEPSSVVVVRAVRSHAIRYAAQEWPCPVCGQRRAVEDSWLLRVRNRTGAAMERNVQVCGDCATRMDVADVAVSGR